MPWVKPCAVAVTIEQCLACAGCGAKLKAAIAPTATAATNNLVMALSFFFTGVVSHNAILPNLLATLSLVCWLRLFLPRANSWWSDYARGRGSAGEVQSDFKSRHPPPRPVASLTPLTANVPRTPHQTPASLAAGHCRHASTIDHVHARAARFADLGDHSARLMKRSERYCVC